MGIRALISFSYPYTHPPDGNKQVIEETHGFWKSFMNGQADGGKLWKKA